MPEYPDPRLFPCSCAPCPVCGHPDHAHDRGDTTAGACYACPAPYTCQPADVARVVVDAA